MNVERIRSENALNIPNALTVLRIALMPIVVWFFRRGNSRWALVVYLAAMLSDVADGIIARKANQVTAIGKLLDPIADKISLFVLLALFVSQGQVSKAAASALLAKEAILILGGIAALRMGIVVAALPIGKLTTLFFAISMAARFMSFHTLADAFLWLTVLLSFVALLWYGAALVRQVQHNRQSMA